MRLSIRIIIGLISCFFILPLQAEFWRAEPVSPIDQQYIEGQIDSIDDLANRHFGRHLSGKKSNDIPIMQRLLDEKVVGPEDVRQLQAMGILLGELLRSERGLQWVIYVDKYGRSRSLKVPGFNKDFIFPATQISRKAEVGVKVNVREVYGRLEQAIEDIRTKPLL